MKGKFGSVDLGSPLYCGPRYCGVAGDVEIAGGKKRFGLWESLRSRKRGKRSNQKKERGGYRGIACLTKVT